MFYRYFINLCLPLCQIKCKEEITSFKNNLGVIKRVVHVIS